MRKSWVAVSVGATAFGLVASYLVLVFRTCDEVRDVPRGSFDHRLCRLGGALIARVPVVAPGNEPLYSSTQADGLAPGHDHTERGLSIRATQRGSQIERKRAERGGVKDGSAQAPTLSISGLMA